MERPEQIVCDNGVDIAKGIGLTVMITITGRPIHPFASGVIVYVVVPVVVPVVDNIWLIVFPLPADAPDTPDWVTVHEKVAPTTLLVIPIDDDAPEHMVCDPGVAATIGIGLTVTTTFMVVPVQPLAIGVIEYVAVPAIAPVAESV